MNFKNSNPFQYKVTSVGVNFSLENSDSEEVTTSRDLEDIAEAIFEDSEIMLAYEEGRIDFSDVETCEEEIRGLITNLNFSENYEESEEY
jgi:hypothetical protein